ncbi:hypothetical protein F5X98DRAFT_296318 [Xylaria grammica]|nr:hypothetical protein F5X98DRAFT_296318 [Xylaria grammica]
MSNELQDAWDELLQGIAAVKSFPYGDFVNRLHNKVRDSFTSAAGGGDILAPYIDNAPQYPADDSNPGSFYVDIFMIADLLDRLLLSSVADGIAGNDEDPEHLKQCVSQDNSKLRYLESLANLMGFCFLEHINMELRSQGRRDLNTLYQMDDFKEFCLEQINSDDFVNTEIHHDLSAGDHRFSISWLIIADYMDNREFVFRSTPSSGPDFASKASYKALNQWSYTLWASVGNESPDQMDQIVEFCGRAATIGLCPLNPTTGLQRPTTVSIVMKSFYSITSKDLKAGDYTRDVQDSLARLQDNEEIIDEWRSYCDTFANTWESQIRRYWITGFYRIFQDKQSRMAKLWLSGAKQNEKLLYNWDAYLPVTKDPYDQFNRSSTSLIPAGTPVTLADGMERLVEAITSEDRILIHGVSQISVPATEKPFHQTGKARLVGFNGENPSIPSSQVFHTATGLRAVDVEEAQRLNPYQRIGQLAVGHIVFRLKGGEYQAVGIRSITQTEESIIDRVYHLSLPGEHQTYHIHGYLVDTNTPTKIMTEIIDLLRKVPGGKRLSLLSHCQEMWPVFRKFDGQCINQRLNWELFGKYQSPDGEKPVLKGSISLQEHLKVGRTFIKPVGIPLDRLARGFSLTPHYPSRLPIGYQLPTLSIIDGYLLVDEQAQLRSAYDHRTRCFRWTRELQQHRLFEHGVVEIHSEAVSGTGVTYLSTNSEADTIPPKDQVHPFEVRARSLERLHTNEGGDGDTWESMGQYQVTIDQSVWPPDTDRTEPETPVSGGIIEDGTMKSPHGVPTYLIQFPLFDQLQNQINEKFGQNLGSFYTVSGEYRDGLQSFTMAFNKAPLVPFISDSGLDIDKKFDVGFQSKLDIDLTLPTLFQQMTITLDVTYEKFSGYLFEYDPTKQGYKGNRHLVTGTLMKSLAAEEFRSRVSSAYASISNPNTSTIANDEFQPAPVTNSLLGLKSLSVNDLMKLPVYNERDLHNTTQLLIKNMMYYHMDSYQRDKILQEHKPAIGKDIPSSLADELQGDLKAFLKQKYAPAFICRYVGRTQKYAAKFTDQEMKNLWYWWEGNGKNCLSQSEEYNDINRLSSRAAMISLYKEQLQPYLDSNRDQWAEDLSDQLLNDKHLMLIYANNPIPDGNNVVNKQCNILDVLSPSTDKANEYFEAFMNFALTQSVEVADIEGEGQDEQYQWIYDSMHDLIVAILEGADWISADVRESLMKDINEFEEQNGLNQRLDSQQRAAAILEKTAIFTREMAGWMSSIGKGLKAALRGTAAFRWAGEAFDKVAAGFESQIAAISSLRGISSLCMVGVSLATAAVTIWGLVSNWDSMSDAGRATVIIQTVRMVVDAAGKVPEAFEAFKSKPTSTGADEINAQALSDSLSDVITANNEKASEIAQAIAGDEDFRTAMGDGLHGKGLATNSEPKESWNEKIGSGGDNVPPGSEEAAKKFNMSEKMLKVLNVILGIGLVVAMSFSLANDWNSMTDTGKALGVLNVVVQGLTVLLDIIDLGETVGLFAVAESMSAALSILGGVLAVIGIVLMIVQIFVNLFVARQPPPDPIQNFIDGVGHALIKTFDNAPEPQLSYTISPTSVKGESVITLQIEGVNNSSSEVTLSHATITLYSGDDDVCLFANGADTIELVAESDSSHGTAGHTYVAPSELSAGQLPSPAKLGNTSNYYEYDLQVAGPPKEYSNGLEYLILKPMEKFQSVWTAVVNSRGDDLEKSTSWIEIVEVGLRDKCQVQWKLQRL